MDSSASVWDSALSPSARLSSGSPSDSAGTSNRAQDLVKNNNLLSQIDEPICLIKKTPYCGKIQKKVQIPIDTFILKLELTP